MSASVGLMLECDRCHEKVFLKRLRVEDRWLDGGVTKYRDESFEETDWAIRDIRLEEVQSLCPKCKSGLDKTIKDYMKTTFSERYKKQGDQIDG